jgi:hypothetical protein
MPNLITSLGIAISVPTVFSNNLGAVVISKEPQLSPNTKHIEILLQYIWRLMINKVIKIIQVLRTEMIADMLTKPLGKIKLAEAYKQLHLINVRV